MNGIDRLIAAQFGGHEKRGPWDKLDDCNAGKVEVYRYERNGHFGGRCPECDGQVSGMQIELCWFDLPIRPTVDGPLAPTYRIVTLEPCGHLFRGENVTLRLVTSPHGRVVNPYLVADLGGDADATEATLARYQGREWVDPADIR